MGSIEKAIYRPDDGSLPSVEMATFEAGQVALTRKAHPQEYIQNLWPVFYADKVSFTCKDAIKIKINEKSTTCNQAIHFIEKPTTLQINDVNDNVCNM